jgi:hypothetical protein
VAPAGGASALAVAATAAAPATMAIRPQDGCITESVTRPSLRD